MSSERSSPENSIIQGLEALLRDEEFPITRHSQSNEGARSSAWRENVSHRTLNTTEFSRDSAFNFSSLSLRSRNPALSNLEYSLESRVSNQSFDPAFFSSPSVKNVSYDGCFVEGDSGIFLNHGRNTSFNQVLSERRSVLSSAISHGGDLRATRSPPALGVQDAYNFARYVVHLRRTWQKIQILNQLWNGLQRLPEDMTCFSNEPSLPSLLTCLTSITIKIQSVLSAKLPYVLQEIRNYLETASLIVRNGEMNWKCLKQVSKIASSLQLIVAAEAQSQGSNHSADYFRSEKITEVWNKLAMLS